MDTSTWYSSQTPGSEAMINRFLGFSGLQVSEICFGVMTFTGQIGWTHLGNTHQEEANRLVDIALDMGVNFFDTADIYSEGISEEMLGKALHGKRNRAVVTTKGGFKMKDGINGDGHSRLRLFEACEASLKRLDTDYIDLYLIHSYDFTTPFEEFLSALNDLVREGKVRYIGVSNFFAWQMMKAHAICEKNGWNKIINLQAYYSLLGRDLEYELMPFCAENGVGITIWSPLHGGILSGKYRNMDKWPEGTRLKAPGHHLPYNTKKGEKILDTLAEIAISKNITMSQLALKYLLYKPAVSSVVIGARDEGQLKENIKASEVTITPDEMQLLDEVSSPGRLYPYWYFDIFRKDRMDKYFKDLYSGNNKGI
jgi:aryl-alcohol dehydrogenase-like predicted oxidoreductase